jgi:hypothetical protein
LIDKARYQDELVGNNNEDAIQREDTHQTPHVMSQRQSESPLQRNFQTRNLRAPSFRRVKGSTGQGGCPKWSETVSRKECKERKEKTVWSEESQLKI